MTQTITVYRGFGRGGGKITAAFAEPYRRYRWFGGWGLAATVYRANQQPQVLRLGDYAESSLHAVAKMGLLLQTLGLSRVGTYEEDLANPQDPCEFTLVSPRRGVRCRGG